MSGPRFPGDLPLCSHSPAHDWGHGTTRALVNPATERVYGITGYCRACRREVKHIIQAPGVPGFKRRVLREGFEDASDYRLDRFHGSNSTREES